MEDFLMFLLLGVAVLSLIPVITMNKNRDDKKYRCLKYLINVAFVWTLLVFIERLSSNLTIVYYAHILGFPLKFLLGPLTVCTFFNYIEKKLPKIIIYLFGLIFVAELALAFTNSSNHLLLLASPNTINGFRDLYQATKGTLFIYHLIVTYFVLISGIVYLFYFLAKNRNVRQYKLITQTMVLSVIVVLFFNLSQLLIVKTDFDLTYVSLIFVTYALFRAIYKKDMVFNLKTSGRGEILSNMREMYILTDAEENVIEISELLLTRYEIDASEFEGKPLNILISKLEDYVVFYSDYQVDSAENIEKDHFHLRKKKFSLRGMNDFGFMILLYDETQVFGLLRELNKLSNYDNMTGLNNRNYIEAKLEKLGKIENVGIVSLDLNGLKANNDYLGHERGDSLLKTLADKMKLVMNNYSEKEIARIGGDEFLILMKDTNEIEVNKVKERILEECKDPDIVKNISVAIGTAFSKEEIDIYSLIQKADANMYRMKQNTSMQYSKAIVEYAKKLDEYIR